MVTGSQASRTISPYLQRDGYFRKVLREIGDADFVKEQFCYGPKMCGIALECHYSTDIIHKEKICRKKNNTKPD